MEFNAVCCRKRKGEEKRRQLTAFEDVEDEKSRME